MPHKKTLFSPPLSPPPHPPAPPPWRVPQRSRLRVAVVAVHPPPPPPPCRVPKPSLHLQLLSLFLYCLCWFNFFFLKWVKLPRFHIIDRRNLISVICVGLRISIWFLRFFFESDCEMFVLFFVVYATLILDFPDFFHVKLLVSLYVINYISLDFFWKEIFLEFFVVNI